MHVMRKAILILLGMLLPISAQALTQISESDLSNITCQAGITIVFDVTMSIHFDTIAWGDPDGYGSTQGAKSSSNNYSSSPDTTISEATDPSYVVRVDPSNMTLKQSGTEFRLFEDIFKRVVLSQ
jgi:hypothetical protein